MLRQVILTWVHKILFYNLNGEVPNIVNPRTEYMSAMDWSLGEYILLIGILCLKVGTPEMHGSVIHVKIA